MKKVVVIHGSNRELTPLKGAIAALGYDALECGCAYEALELVSSEPVEALISSVSLPDLSGYQLACIVKSMERTKMLPIIVVNVYGGKGEKFSKPVSDDFALLAGRCRMVVEVTDSPQALKVLQSLLSRSDTIQRSLAVTLSKSKRHSANHVSLEGNRYSAENLLRSASNTLNDLLIDKVVLDKILPVLKTIESRNTFAEHYISVARQLVDCSICGLVLVCSPAPWGTILFSENRYSKKGLQDWLKTIGEDNLEGLEIDFNVQGQLHDDGELLPEPSIFQIGKEENIVGLLIFAPKDPSGFDELSLKAIRCLQERMDPIMQVRIDRERLIKKRRFPIITDELTGVFNLDFLIGFMQQQLLFSFRQRVPLSLILLQIEGLREINSKLGWETGNHILAQIATWLNNHMRGSDIVGRCSGDTFAIILPSTNLEGSRVAGRKFTSELRALKFANEPPLKFNIGCAVAKPSELSAEVLLRDAQDDLKSHVSNSI